MIEWTVEIRKLSDLKLWDKNPRTISEKAYAKLKERISKRGMHDVLKVDTHDVVLSGNQRLRVLKELGYDEVEVKVPERELTEKEMQEVALESNTNDGEWDSDLLANGFEEDMLEDLGLSGLLPKAIDSNEEVDVDSFGDTGVLSFKLPKDDYMRALQLLANAVEKTESDTNEECIMKLLEQYE